MGIKDWFGRRESAAPMPVDALAVEALAPVSGTGGAQLGEPARYFNLTTGEGFMSGHDGQRSLAWASHNAPVIGGGYGMFYGTPGSELSRERSRAAAVTAEMMIDNNSVATVILNSNIYTVGNGLTLSSRPDHIALGITPGVARGLGNVIEHAWLAYVNSARECDASGRFGLHMLASAVYTSWIVTGEALFAIDSKAVPGTRTRSKVKLLDPRQLDQTITRNNADGSSVFQGVQFDKNGRLEGYWIRPATLGNVNSAAQAVFERAYTSWGRPRLVHLMDLLRPNLIRGLSPLTAALTTARSKGVLQEFTLGAALTQTLVAATIESALPHAQAMQSLQAADYGGAPQGESAADWAAVRSEHYKHAPMSFKPGAVGHLARGDTFKLHRPEAPGDGYQPFDKSLGRSFAKAAGMSAEDTSGDFSDTSFSASRLAMELPHRIVLRRRQIIVEPFYQAVYSAWLEEMMETERIALPSGAPKFWEAPEAYCASMWRGSGKPVADIYKQRQADVLALENGLTTFEEVLGADGKDLESHIAQRKAERLMFETAGLEYPKPKTAQAQAATPDDVADAVSERN